MRYQLANRLSAMSALHLYRLYRAADDRFWFWAKRRDDVMTNYWRARCQNLFDRITARG